MAQLHCGDESSTLGFPKVCCGGGGGVWRADRLQPISEDIWTLHGRHEGHAELGELPLQTERWGAGGLAIEFRLRGAVSMNKKTLPTKFHSLPTYTSLIKTV